jgi:hypothetical protein
MRNTVILRLTLGIALAYAAPGAAQTALGSVDSSLVHLSGIVLTFASHPSGVALGGSGTFSATLNFGNVGRFGVTPAAGVSQVNTATDFTVSTPFFVHVADNTLFGRPSYQLNVCLQTADAVRTWKIDTFTVPACATTVTIANAEPYDVNRSHTLFITIPMSSAAGPVSNVLNFTAVSN